MLSTLNASQKCYVHIACTHLVHDVEQQGEGP